MPTFRENYRERSEKSQIFEIDLRIFLSTIFPGPGMDLPAAREYFLTHFRSRFHNPGWTNELRQRNVMRNFVIFHELQEEIVN